MKMISEELTELYLKRSRERFTLAAFIKQGRAGKGEIQKTRDNLSTLERAIKLEELKLEKEKTKQAKKAKKEIVKDVPQIDLSNTKTKKDYVLKLIQESGENDPATLQALSDGYDGVLKERGNELKALSFLADILYTRTKEPLYTIWDKIHKFEID